MGPYNNPATQEHIYAALGESFHSKMNQTFKDLAIYGLYRSTDGGITGSISVKHPDNAIVEEHFNDIDVQEVSNRLWLSTTRSSYNERGNFTLQNQMERQVLLELINLDNNPYKYSENRNCT